MTLIVALLQLLLQIWNKFDIHKILHNHLPHIEARLKALEDRNSKVDNGGL